jgi:peptide deformylase
MQEYKDQAARIIQHQIKHWLYSAPNGLLFLKHVKQLQNDGYLLI